MNWDTIISALLPLLLNILAGALPGLGSLIGGPLGLIVSLFISSIASYLAKEAGRLEKFGKIDKEISDKAAKLSAAATEVFDLEMKQKNGESVDQKAFKEAAEKMFEAGKQLIKDKKGGK